MLANPSLAGQCLCCLYRVLLPPDRIVVGLVEMTPCSAYDHKSLIQCRQMDPRCLQVHVCDHGGSDLVICTFRIIFADVAMILTGLFAALCENNNRWGFYIISSAFFLIVLWGLLGLGQHVT